MFSRKKSFKKSEDDEECCMSYSRSERGQNKNLPTSAKATTSNKSHSKTELPEDLSNILVELKTVETKIQNRCEKMDSLCQDYMNSPVEVLSFPTEDSSPQTEEEFSLTLDCDGSLMTETFEIVVEVCAETALENLKERKKKSWCLWRKTKLVARELLWPRIVSGSVG